MITIRIQPWNSVDTGKEHILTEFQLGSSLDFTNPSNLLMTVNGTVDNKMLTMAEMNLVIPANTIWYTRYKRSFDDGTAELDFSIPEPAYSSDVNNSKFIKTTSTIEKPSLRVVDKETYLEVTSSTPKITGNDGHLYTTYLLYSGGELKWTRLKDEDNLTSLSIVDSILDFKTLDSITLYVIYGTANGTESPMATFNLSISKLKYSLSGTFSNIPYNKGQTYTLNSEDNDSKVVTSFLYNGSGSELGDPTPLSYANRQSGLLKYSEVYLPSDIIKPNAVYTLRLNISSILNPDIIEVRSYVISSEAVDVPFLIDRDYVYRHKEYKTYDGGKNGYLQLSSKVNSFNIAYANAYRDIFLTSVSYPNSLSNFKFYASNLELTLDRDMELSISSKTNYKISFVTKDKRLIIALADSDTELKVVVFNYNPFGASMLTQTSTATYAITGAKDLIKNNGVAISEEEDYLYALTIAEGASQLVRIDINSKSTTILPGRPGNTSNTNLINLGGDKFLSNRGGGNNNTFYIYGAAENIWMQYNAVFPTDIVYENTNVGILRKDGNILFVPTKGYPAKYLLVMDPVNKTYTEETLSLSDTMFTSSIVRDTSGAILIITEDKFNSANKTIVNYY